MTFITSLSIILILATSIYVNAESKNEEASTSFDFTSHVPDTEIYRELETAYFVDDMIFNSDKRMATSTAQKWPKGVVPYIVSPNVTASLTNVINQAVDYINKYTCVKFRKWMKTDQYWIRFVKDPDPSPTKLCASFVGFLNKKDQGIFLGPKCSFGSMVHEMLHALGFNHEHTRNDRDQYIKVNPNNFASTGVASNYALDKTRCRTGTCTYNDYGVNYNYESIMHYCPRCSCKPPNCPVFTVVPQSQAPNRKKPVGNTAKIGQREGFSNGDWIMVNKRYGCNIQQQDEPDEISEDPVMQEPDEYEINSGGGGTGGGCSADNNGGMPPPGIDDNGIDDGIDDSIDDGGETNGNDGIDDYIQD